MTGEHTTRSNLDQVLDYAFNEMLRLVKGYPQLSSRPIPIKLMDTSAFKSTMFTVASSKFRLVVLVHAHPFENLPQQAWEHLSIEAKEEDYQDFISELGNNLCGVICRLLSDAGLSTGLSTPIILGNSKSTDHLRAVAPDYETHTGSFMGQQSLLMVSLCLFTNSGKQLELTVPIPSPDAAPEDSGELEFF